MTWTSTHVLYVLKVIFECCIGCILSLLSACVPEIPHIHNQPEDFDIRRYVYNPRPILSGVYTQVLLRNNPPTELKYKRVIYNILGFNEVAIDFVSNIPTHSKFVLVVPGMNATAKSYNCKFMCHEAVRRGWGAGVFVRPGYDGLRISNPHNIAYHEEGKCIHELTKQLQYKTIHAIGMCYGGCSVARCASFDDTVLASSISISSNFSFGDVIVRKTILQRIITHFCLEYLNNHACWKQYTSCEILDTKDFIQKFCAKVTSTSNFCEVNSACLEDVRVPLLCIQSKDDPMLDCRKQRPRNPLVTVVTTRRGGHGSWVQRYSNTPWYIRVCFDYLSKKWLVIDVWCVLDVV